MNQSTDEKSGTNDSSEDKYSLITRVVSTVLAPLGVTWAKDVQAEVKQKTKDQIAAVRDDSKQ